MFNLSNTLTESEKLQLELRELYIQNGYKRYLVSKFEEYDLYANNKDFLMSNRVITFTDTDGKLMALKPDVTLSIVKNSKDNDAGTLKIFYDENVFRISKDSLNFKEINQTGLECLGEIDDFKIIEVMSLAVQSLDKISGKNALNVSDLDIVLSVLDTAEIVGADRAYVLGLISAKNVHGIEEFCSLKNVNDADAKRLQILASLRGKISKVENSLKELAESCEQKERIDSFIKIIKFLSQKFGEEKINVDFSIISDTNYYNGITFNGVIEGVPTTVLSGGRYDKLMKRLKRKAGAIGFAIYLDALSKVLVPENLNVIDAVVLYSENSDIQEVFAKAEEIKLQGKTVSIMKDNAKIEAGIVVDLR